MGFVAGAKKTLCDKAAMNSTSIGADWHFDRPLELGQFERVNINDNLACLPTEILWVVPRRHEIQPCAEAQ